MVITMLNASQNSDENLTAFPQNNNKVKRAAAYIRVSTKHDKQCHSLEFQQYYWNDYLSKQPEYELVKIYSDFGISGKTQSKRPEFLSMIQDCNDGKIDVIFTKSVQRFGRNTTELLTTVRELRDKGIEVIFDKENIHTFAPNTEMYLIMAASIAENDLDSNSLNQKWAYKEKFSNGYISIGSRILGYNMKENNTLEIVESEAKIVREIFELYASGKNLSEICRLLNAKGYKNKDGNTLWRYQAVTWILDNVRYVGDNIQQKTILMDGINKMNNDGKYAKQWFMRDVNPAIVSRELFNKVKQLRQISLQNNKRQPLKTYDFSGLIKCEKCQTNYRHITQNPHKAWECEVWACGKGNALGQKACDNLRIKDSVLKEKFVESYNEFVENRYETDNVQDLQNEHNKLVDNVKQLNLLKTQRLISVSDYFVEQQKLDEQISILSKKIDSQTLRFKSDEYDKIENFSKDKLDKFIKSVTIKDYVVTFIFYNDVRVSRKYAKEICGNKKGWSKKGRQ